MIEKFERIVQDIVAGPGRRKRARQADLHLRQLPEHLKKDIGWNNGSSEGHEMRAPRVFVRDNFFD